ncbi:MAG: GNAT family N-acetyltransferase [Gammaproteobacteria bacterium]|nr:GNAT family N-acetyltransferase [Pseudomonadales bacterium]
MIDKIRKAAKEEFDAIDAVLEQGSIYQIAIEPDWMADTTGISQSDFNDYIGNPEKDILVCERNGQIVGVIQLSVGFVEDPGLRHQPFGCIDEIAVADGFRSQGVGSKLMSAAESWAIDRSLKMLRLDLWSKNIHAVKLYEKHGFSVIRQRMFRTIGSNDT